MSAPVGPRGRPAPTPVAAQPPLQPEMPDLSHLTEEERKIILAVMDRQKKEEEKEQSVLKKLHQQFEMYKEQVKKMGEESQQQQEQKGDAPTCGICHKTKFADGCGHNCSYCQTKFCARCGGRVSLRSNKVQKWLCGYVICAENNKKSSLNQEHGFIIVDLIHHSNLIKRFFEDCGMRRRLRRRKQNCTSRPSSKDPQVTYLYLQWRKVDLMGSQDRILLKMGQE
uniref:Regulating synaptic membrane exocytosis 2 n=1 Tax=Molossus molossus TaxID=27622 RepID=A0A7J8DUA0_MOLMO|nr:regulating synaptic membrane exocytosis 2 [Molossus molossus]